MKTLENKVALVTGSSGGLGKAIAERFAKLGASVIIHYNSNKENADLIVKAIIDQGGQAVAFKADTTQVTEIESLFQNAKQAFGKLDIIVANAGIEHVELPVSEITEGDFDKVFTINTKGTYFTIQQASVHVEDNGRIIYIASSTTVFPVPGMAVYGGSKTTPKYLVEVLAKEIGHRGVTVNSIIPFAVDHSGIFAKPESYPELRKSLLDSCPMGRLAEVEDVANVAEFFASDLSSFVNGQHLLVNGGATQ
jgi:3-oxoacyl-[acyl-carrier protein] reductase